MSALEDGFDQVVAVCILGQHEDQGRQLKALRTMFSKARFGSMFLICRHTPRVRPWVIRFYPLFWCRLPRQPGQILAQNHGQ